MRDRSPAAPTGSTHRAGRRSRPWLLPRFLALACTTLAAACTSQPRTPHSAVPHIPGLPRSADHEHLVLRDGALIGLIHPGLVQRVEKGERSAGEAWQHFVRAIDGAAGCLEHRTRIERLSLHRLDVIDGEHQWTFATSEERPILVILAQPSRSPRLVIPLAAPHHLASLVGAAAAAYFSVPQCKPGQSDTAAESEGRP